MRLPAAALLILTLLQAQEPIVVHPPQLPDPETVEPPARFLLRAGEWSAPVMLGEAFTLPDELAGAECRLERMPTRRMVLPGALSFEYPDGARWMAATHVPEFCWWNVAQDGEFLMLQRHRGTGDALHHRELYVQNCLKIGCADEGECYLFLDNRLIIGRRVSGKSDVAYVQEVYSLEQAGATWLLVFNTRAGQPAPLRERILATLRLDAAR